jgi:hypothetical protein
LTFSENTFSVYIFAVNLNTMGKNTLEVTAAKKQAMIDALEANFGNITAAAKQADISVRTHYKWLKEDEDYEDEVTNIKDISFGKMKETLLEKAMKRIDDGNTAVLNQLLRIYFKKLPDEMEVTSRVNDNTKWDIRNYEEEEAEEDEEENDELGITNV